MRPTISQYAAVSYNAGSNKFTVNSCKKSSDEAAYRRASSLAGSNQVQSNAGLFCHLSESIQKVCPCKITQTYDDTLVAKRLASSEEIQTRLASQSASDFVATRNTWAPAHEKDYVCVSLDGCEIDGDIQIWHVGDKGLQSKHTGGWCPQKVSFCSRRHALE